MDLADEARRQWIAHGWGSAANGVATVVALERAHRIVVTMIETVLKPMGLTFARFEVLRTLAFSESGHMQITTLSKILQVHTTSITNAVERLAADGLVHRRKDLKDGRALHAAISKRGVDVVDSATQELKSSVLVDVGLTPREMAVLWSTLRALRANAGDFLPVSVSSDRARRP